MHGDIDHPADAVISKDDYESYPIKMGAFLSALRGAGFDSLQRHWPRQMEAGQPVRIVDIDEASLF